MTTPVQSPPTVVVVGANGLVGSHVCAALVERGARVRALVRRAGTAPPGDGIEEHVGDFTDPATLSRGGRPPHPRGGSTRWRSRNPEGGVLDGADAVVTTVHPMHSDRATQQRVGVEGTPRFARAARDVGVQRLVHLSTAGVVLRTPEVGDVDEDSPLVGDDAGTYAVTKRDTDRAIGAVSGLTRVLVRPPAILGSGETSVWNTLNPTGMRDDEQHRRANPRQTFAWVHVDDLAALVADLAVGRIRLEDGSCTAVDVAGEPATLRDYVGTVCAALGVEPVWDDRPVWTGQILAARAQGWGWAPQVSLAAALTELDRDVRRLRR